MNNDNISSITSPADALTALIRSGARRLITEAVEAELDVFLGQCQELLPTGQKRVVRNGHLPEREIMTGIGKVSVQVPRVRDRGQGESKVTFKSALIPPYMRRSATLNEVLPLLYLKGISEKDFGEALQPIFGEQTNNLSPGVISRLKQSWAGEYKDWCKRDLTQSKFVYWWVDGIHFTARADDNRCVLVVIGVNEEGRKELIALEDGFRESTDSWLFLLRQLRDRGLSAPSLAVGDGALGFWNAVDEVFPSVQHQRCWFHKMGNVLDKLPKSQQANAKVMLNEIYQSATRNDAIKAIKAFKKAFEAKYPKATNCLTKNQTELLAFYDYPAEHWGHLRTTNPIESTFATVRNRTYKCKGAFSPMTILMMTFKLMQSAEKRWIRIRGFNQLDNVIKGVKFKDGVITEPVIDNKLNHSDNKVAA